MVELRKVSPRTGLGASPVTVASGFNALAGGLGDVAGAGLRITAQLKRIEDIREENARRNPALGQIRGLRITEQGVNEAIANSPFQENPEAGYRTVMEEQLTQMVESNDDPLLGAVIAQMGSKLIDEGHLRALKTNQPRRRTKYKDVEDEHMRASGKIAVATGDLGVLDAAVFDNARVIQTSPVRDDVPGDINDMAAPLYEAFLDRVSPDMAIAILQSNKEMGFDAKKHSDLLTTHHMRQAKLEDRERQQADRAFAEEERVNALALLEEDEQTPITMQRVFSIGRVSPTTVKFWRGKRGEGSGGATPAVTNPDVRDGWYRDMFDPGVTGDDRLDYIIGHPGQISETDIRSWSSKANATPIQDAAEDVIVKDFTKVCAGGLGVLNVMEKIDGRRIQSEQCGTGAARLEAFMDDMAPGQMETPEGQAAAKKFSDEEKGRFFQGMTSKLPAPFGADPSRFALAINEDPDWDGMEAELGISSVVMTERFIADRKKVTDGLLTQMPATFMQDIREWNAMAYHVKAGRGKASLKQRNAVPAPAPADEETELSKRLRADRDR